MIMVSGTLTPSKICPSCVLITFPIPSSKENEANVRPSRAVQGRNQLVWTTFVSFCSVQLLTYISSNTSWKHLPPPRQKTVVLLLLQCQGSDSRISILQFCYSTLLVLMGCRNYVSLHRQSNYSNLHVSTVQNVFIGFPDE